ncbi:unnamed protein product, partial [Didymodactylos carnosus]
TDELKFIRDNKEKNHGKLIVLNFEAEWSQPCKQIGPKIDDWSVDYFKDHVVFLKCDIGQAKLVAEEYKINSLPTFILFKDGKICGRVIGANVKQLKKTIEEQIGGKPRAKIKLKLTEVEKQKENNIAIESAAMKFNGAVLANIENEKETFINNSNAAEIIPVVQETPAVIALTSTDTATAMKNQRRKKKTIAANIKKSSYKKVKPINDVVSVIGVKGEHFQQSSNIKNVTKSIKIAAKILKRKP